VDQEDEMEVDKYEDGVPSWVDLGTADIEAAVTFYGALFGWEAPELPPEAGGYRVCTLRGLPVAGLGPQMNPGPPVWATYVSTSDADAVAARVTVSGGQTLAGPFDVLDSGRMAVFADPSGAVFSVWQPNQHAGAGLVNEPGTYAWSELVATDVPGALAFYPEVFGWSANRMPPNGDPVQYVEWKIGDRSVAGMLPKPEAMPAEVPAFWGVYFTVVDTDATVEQVVRLGGQIVQPATDIEPGRFAVVTDPTGAMFNVMALRPPAPPA
jgi:predicted enzyme related to lactoylglutathione lyase